MVERHRHNGDAASDVDDRIARALREGDIDHDRLLLLGQGLVPWPPTRDKRSTDQSATGRK